MRGWILMFLAKEIEEILKFDGVTYQIKDFSPDHLINAPLRPLDALLVEQNKEQLIDRLPQGYSFSGLANGRIYAMWGIVPLWKGVFEAWLIPTSDLDEHKFKMCRSSLKFFEYTAKILRARRYQCYVHCQNFLSIKWIELMLFENEGELRQFGADGSNFKLYSRIF